MVVSANRQAFINLILSRGTLNERYGSLSLLSSDGGFFSILFRAYDEKSRRDVAIKFYDPDKRSDDYRLKCFHREAGLLQQLKGQKNIVEVIDGLSQYDIVLKDTKSGIELTHSYEFIALELAKGDIEAYIYNNNSEDIKTAITKLIYFRQMCKAVARIHRAKICHRDLKPSNFLIFKQEIKLSDLGTATTQDGRTPLLPSYPMPVGDMGYWSPEQFCNIGICDENAFSADIFSLGAILFEMFTKTRLTLKVYDGPLVTKLSGLRNHLSVVGPSQRKSLFDGTIDAVVTPHRLPDIFSFNNSVPPCIRDSLNNLYKGLAHLNYNKRENSFDSIIRRVDICILMARNFRAQKVRFKRRRLLRDRIC